MNTEHTYVYPRCADGSIDWPKFRREYEVPQIFAMMDYQQQFMVVFFQFLEMQNRAETAECLLERLGYPQTSVVPRNRIQDLDLILAIRTRSEKEGHQQR